MDEVAAPLRKTIYIDIDSDTIKKNITLVFTFEDMVGGSDVDHVAWKIGEVIYSPGNTQEFEVIFQAQLGFAIASKQEGKYIIAGSKAAMTLQETVDIVKSGKTLLFGDRISPDGKLKENQISTRNNASQPVGVSVGFMQTKTTINSVGYISDLGHKNQWVATYHPNMKLYIASDAKEGQVIDTISKSDVVHIWNLASSNVPDGSRWFLIMDDETGEYKISKE